MSTGDKLDNEIVNLADQVITKVKSNTQQNI